MNSKQFNETLESKQASLKKIMDTKYPINPKLSARHEERVFNASNYYDELKYLCLSTDKPILIVSKATFEKKTAAADFAIVESDGMYHMIALISSFPEIEYYIIWLESLSNL